MSQNLSHIQWGRVLLGVVLAFVIAYGSSIVVVTGYATLLAFQARGAPDIALINGFAASYAGLVTSLFFGVGAFFGGRFAGRKAPGNAFQQGLMVGLGTATIDVGLNLVGGFSLLGLVSLLLALGGGWLGGKLSAKQRQMVVNSVV
jgi:hypothetical protein